MYPELSSITLANTALLIIDEQMEFAHRREKGVPRSTPEAEDNIASILAHVREVHGTVVHIHHHAIEPGSPFTTGLPGAQVQPFVAPRDGEPVYAKHANSGFVGTSLEADLRAAGIANVICCGGTANHCVETTARHAENLGFGVIYLADGVWAYGATGPDGRTHSPEDVLSVTLSNIHGEFANVVQTAAAIAALGA